jgi:hypothetical protein
MTTTASPTPGSWARADGFVGLVTAVDEERVTLLDPGRRAQHTADAARVEVVPAAAVRVTVTVDLPMPHGLPEESLRRWVAMLTDPVLRERASEALADVAQDTGPAEPRATLDVVALADGRARCLCGHTVAATPGTAVTCPSCGRPAAPPVAPSDG